MATPKTTIWECAPHTHAKHILLEKYLKAWFPILGRHNERVIYIDGFAGPGEYSKGEKGSPLVVLDVAKSHTANLTGELCFYFVENDSNRFDHIKSVIEQNVYPTNFKIDTALGEFADILEADLNSFDATGAKNAPIFAFIDPFGFSGVPYDLLKRLLILPKTEVFVYFARSSVNRFLDNDKVEHHMRELFGTDIVEFPGGPDRLNKLKIFYESRLKQAAKFVGSFTMADNNGTPIYDLFFASNNALGYVKMKEAMWAVDESGGFRFSDKDNPNQSALFKHDPLPPLIQLIVDRGRKRKGINVDKIETFVCNETIYLTKHMKAALKHLEESGMISVQPIKLNGDRRRGKFFSPGTVIDFA